ncbi:unnamed protein product [Calicophoron daubneyi]|uniref:Succinate dehydrogenase cytochrome b556 subunit n=1 Tax=Calicophoron daubneyi TaxID=300641 RepID=A0AAV2TY17_CALDB
MAPALFSPYGPEDRSHKQGDSVERASVGHPRCLNPVWVFFGISAFWFTGHYDQMIDFVKALSLGPAVIAGCKFLVAYFPCYHCLNGVRHLAWDNAMGFPIKTCNRTGFTVLSLSVLCAAALAMLRVEA